VVEVPTVADSTGERPDDAAPRAPAEDQAGRWRGLRWRSGRASPFLLAAVACFALAALSAALLPTVPSYDPWSWIVWGREVVDPHLSFATGGGPSWKPLPVLFTTVFALFGGAAPTLWVITARAGGLLALVAAWRLGSLLGSLAGPLSGGLPGSLAGGGRCSGRYPTWAGAVAGLVAAAGVALTQEWSYYMFRGTSEPMLVGASLWAIDRHLAGRRGEAFALGVAASLIRPEAWPFILAYGVWLWLREPRLRVLIVAGLAAIPLLWFVPPWIGSGQPFLASSHAKQYNGHLGKHPLFEVLRRGVDLQVAPMLVLALVAVALAWFRDRSRLVLGLAGCALAWWALVVAMTLDGYPGLERFYLPAAGITCVLAGAGVVWLARAAGEAVAAAGRHSAAAPVCVGVAAALIAISIPFTTSRIDDARAQKPVADKAVTRLDQLSAAAAAVGGHARVFPCHSSFSAVNHAVQTALAWKLHVTLARVGTSMRHPGVLFVGPHDSIDGGAAAISPRLDRMQLLAHVGAWRVYRVWRAGHSTRCVGR
jgi:hypothetical protein